MGAVDKRSSPINLRRDPSHANRIQHLALVSKAGVAADRTGGRRCAFGDALAVGAGAAEAPLLDVAAVVAHLHRIHGGCDAAGVERVARRELHQRGGHAAGELEGFRINLQRGRVELGDHHGKLHRIIQQREVGQQTVALHGGDPVFRKQDLADVALCAFERRLGAAFFTFQLRIGVFGARVRVCLRFQLDHPVLQYVEARGHHLHFAVPQLLGALELTNQRLRPKARGPLANTGKRHLIHRAFHGGQVRIYALVHARGDVFCQHLYKRPALGAKHAGCVLHLQALRGEVQRVHQIRGDLPVQDLGGGQKRRWRNNRPCDHGQRFVQLGQCRAAALHKRQHQRVAGQTPGAPHTLHVVGNRLGQRRQHDGRQVSNINTHLQRWCCHQHIRRVRCGFRAAECALQRQAFILGYQPGVLARDHRSRGGGGVQP